MASKKRAKNAKPKKGTKSTKAAKPKRSAKSANGTKRKPAKKTAKEPERVAFTRFRYFNQTGSDVSVSLRLRRGGVLVHSQPLNGNQYVRPDTRSDDAIQNVADIDTVVLVTRVVTVGGLTVPVQHTLGPTAAYLTEACAKRDANGQDQFCSPCPCT